MIELKTPSEIEAMKPAGRFVAGILTDLKAMTKVGTNLLEIDDFVRRRIESRKGAESCYVDYAPDFGTGPFAHYICTSVNDAVLHGVPHDYALKDGDLLSLDLAISVDGWVADSAISFVVGEKKDPEDLRLIKCTEEALAAAIDAAQSGNAWVTCPAPSAMWPVPTATRSTWSSAATASATSCTATRMCPTTARPTTATSCVRAWSSPSNRGSSRPRRDLPGSQGRLDPQVLRRLARAHSEHTIAITDNGPIILTARDE